MTNNVLAKSFKKVTHCIFDLDGLLLDTETLYTKAIQGILSKYGKNFTWDVKVTLMGLNAEQFAKRMVEAYDLPMTWQEYTKMQRSITTVIMADAKFMPGAECLLRHLHTYNVPFALATSSAEDMVAIKTAKYQDIFQLFNHKVCGSTDPEVKLGKPAPDIFQVAAQRFSDIPDPGNCLVFEDAPNGVQAAIAAGMQVVMVPDKEVPRELCAPATKVLNCLAEFKPEEFGLPPYGETLN